MTNLLWPGEDRAGDLMTDDTLLGQVAPAQCANTDLTGHTAAALAVDERPDGAWHAEWDTLRILARRSLVAASQCSELLTGLQIHPDQMATHAADRSQHT